VSQVGWVGRAGWQHGQREHKIEVVVGGDAVEALKTAAQTAMDEHMLAVGPLEGADGFHQPTTGASAISRCRGVDVARVEAEGAMVAVVTTTRQRANKAAAVPTGEAVGGSMGGARSTRRVAWVGTLGRLRPPFPAAPCAASVARFAHSPAPLSVAQRSPASILPHPPLSASCGSGLAGATNHAQVAPLTVT